MITQVPFEKAGDIWRIACDKNDFPVPFLCYDWHALWYKVFAKKENAYVLNVNDAVIVPFIKEGHTVKFSGGEEIADYLDILGPKDQKNTAWEEIMDFLKKDRISHIHLRNIPENSPTLSFFSRLPDAGIQKEDTTPHVMLPHTWEEYLSSLTRKYRHELERKIRKFEREHPNASFSESTNPAQDIHTFLKLMEKDPAKAKFLTEKMKTFFIEMTREFHNQISLLLLSMNGVSSAATLSFVHNKTYYLYNSGFDRSCCQNGGLYLKAQSIKRAIEKGFEEYNFLQGSERYKYELGGEDFGVYTIRYSLP